MGAQIFPKVTSTKMNVIEQLEFEHYYNFITVAQVGHNAMGGAQKKCNLWNMY